MKKSVLELMKMSAKHRQHELCHPRKDMSFDHSAMDRKIEQIKQRKEQLRLQAEEKQREIQQKIQRYESNPFQQLLDDSLVPLSEETSHMLKQKLQFIEQKVYIGTKDNVNQQYINRVIDANDTGQELKKQLGQFMSDILCDVESQIIEGNLEVFNKKESISPNVSSFDGIAENSSRQIKLKKIQLSNKIGQLKDELVKSEQQQQELSLSMTPYRVSKSKSISLKPLLFKKGDQSALSNSINIQDFALKSEKTKQAQEFVKNIQKEQEQKRIRRRKKQQELKRLEIKSLQQKQQYQHKAKTERHQKLIKKYEDQRQQKEQEREKALKAKQDYQKFLQDYKKRIPLYKEKDITFKNKMQQEQTQRALSVLSQIKEAKRSVDIKQVKQHEQKYRIAKKQFENQKLSNLKLRQRQIHLRHKQDKQYYRGRYHSLIKEEEETVPQDPSIKRIELLKRKKQFAERVKKQYAPSPSQQKQKQLQELIQKIKTNKSSKQQKNSIELGNLYLAQLHQLVKQIKLKENKKVEIPQQIQPRYKDYLKEVRLQRQSRTIDYERKSSDWLQRESKRAENNANQKQKQIRTSKLDITQQMKNINELDMQLLKAVTLKAKMLKKLDPSSSQSDED